MKLLEKILVATDFSQSSGYAVQTAQALAKAFGSEIILIHVIPKVPDSLVNLRTVRMAIRERLYDLSGELTKAGVRAVETVVEVGVAFDRIIRVSERLDVNAIVVGSGDRAEGGAGHLGVTPERLARKASKPVLVAKAGATPVFKRILCAVDLSDPSRRALANAVHLARTFQAELAVLHVAESLPELYLTAATIASEAQSKYQRQERRAFAVFLEAFDFTDVIWTKTVRQGGAPQEILNYVREWSADLLIMGSVGRTGLSRILLGSVAGKVLREMPCSVITVKSERARTGDAPT